jgi:hypothetical protein
MGYGVSTVFQLYRSGQFNWWRKPEYLETTIDQLDVTDKLYHIMLCQAQCGIYESALSDHIWLHFDQSGELLGVSLVTEPAECKSIMVDSSDLMHWNTTVDITQTVQGPQ